VLSVSASDLRQAFADETLLELAQLGTVCVYDQAGQQASGPVPKGVRRTIRDVSDDLALLLGALSAPRPYVLVGNSFGGDVFMDFASSHPDGVGAVVLLDVPPPDPTLTEKEAGGSWRDNEDLLDAVAAEHTLAAHPPHVGSIVVRAVVAADGQTNVKDQSFWLRLTSRGSVVEVDGDHGLFYSNPAAVVEQIGLAEAGLR
jgi:pimeloyl-ACP methyl ester carboxylesterase